MCKKNSINLRYNIKNGKRKIQNKTNTNKGSGNKIWNYRKTMTNYEFD